MRRLTERWLVVALLFVTAAYAVAEDITLTTYYPSPRGVYQEVRWGTNARASLNSDQGAAIELRGTGIPYIDFSNDAVTDFDMRLILANDDTFSMQGGKLSLEGNAALLDMVGVDHAYIQWYPDGTGAGRRGWIGYGSAPDNNLTIADEIAGSTVVLSPSATTGTLCLGSPAVCRSGWPVMNFGDFIGGDDFNTNPGANPVGGTAVSQVQWVKCSYRNGGGFGTGIWTANSGGPAGFSCYWRRYNDCCGAASGSCAVPCPNRTAIMAVCPANWKVLSGGSLSYHGTVNDIRPDGVMSDYPNSWNGYNLIPAGGGSGSWGSILVGNQEGWVQVSRDSSGFDANVVWASCGN